MKKIFFSCCLLFNLVSYGQVIRFQSLREVLDYADLHATAIQNARMQQLSYTSRERQAGLSLLPAVNGNAGYTDNITLQPTLVPAQLFNPAAPAETFNEYTFGKRYMYNTGLQLSWDVMNFQKLFSIQTADAQSKLGQAQTGNTKFEICNQLANTYYAILLSEKYILFSQKNLELTDSLYISAKEKYNKGIINEDALNRTRIEYLQAENTVQYLKADVKQLRLQFQIQLGISGEIELTEDLSGKVLTVASSGFPNMHPALAMQEAQTELAAKQVRQSRAFYYPSLNLVYQCNYSWSTDQFMDFSAVNELPQQYFGIRLGIPIFNGLQTRETVQQSAIALKQQELILDNTRNAAEKEDEILQIQYQQQLAALMKMEEILSVQNTCDEHISNQYQAGMISLDERLNRFQDVLTVQNQYMQSLSDYYISYYKIYIRQMPL